MTIRQMSRLYSGVYNLYKTTYSGGQITRSTANNSAKNVSTNWISPKSDLESKFDNAMTNLKNSAAEVKKLDLDSEDATKTLEKFLNDYNNSTNFFAENNSVSSRFSRLANNFADTKYFAKNYSAVGIDVGKDGTLTLDEEKFANAVEGDSKKVSRTLEGLASRAESKISLANLQKNNLFATTGFTNYSAFGKLNNFSSVGNFLNFMF